MFGWPDHDWSYIPYQEGVILIHRKPQVLKGLDGELMNCFVSAGTATLTPDMIADKLYRGRPEPEWLLSEITHRVTRLRKYLAPGPIKIKTIRDTIHAFAMGGGKLVGWKLDGLRDIPQMDWT